MSGTLAPYPAHRSGFPATWREADGVALHHKPNGHDFFIGLVAQLMRRCRVEHDGVAGSERVFGEAELHDERATKHHAVVAAAMSLCPSGGDGPRWVSDLDELQAVLLDRQKTLPDHVMVKVQARSLGATDDRSTRGTGQDGGTVVPEEERHGQIQCLRQSEESLDRWVDPTGLDLAQQARRDTGSSGESAKAQLALAAHRPKPSTDLFGWMGSFVAVMASGHRGPGVSHLSVFGRSIGLVSSGCGALLPRPGGS